MKFSTKAIHVGQDADRETGATVIPIHLSSTFTQTELGQHRGFEYSRSGNPTRAALEKCLASLENADHALCFSSGSAASQAILSLLSPGDHVVASSDLYGGTFRLFTKVFSKYGIEFSFVDGASANDFADALRPETKMLWAESPTNPLLTLVDLQALASLSKAHKLLFVVDNTFASPYFQRPLEFGADITTHSVTKYLAGHSDVVGGALMTSRKDLHDALKFHQNAVGAVPSPFDCWLTLRGLKTLSLRMRQHATNALALARWLESHPAVDRVHYPGLASHPQHELAQKQMSGFSGIVSFKPKGGAEATRRFLNALKIFSLAESLGGVESLVCHPASMTHASIPREVREARGVDDALIRLSVGVEDLDDLRDDLEQALAKI